MQIDAKLESPPVDRAGPLAAEAERLGFDGAWITEQKHSPWTLATMMADHTESIDIGTAIAVAFPRSPMVSAYSAWDVQDLSDGRFLFGLGTQVKGHIQRRFGATWDEPGPRLREYVRVLRHIWEAWAEDGEVDFQGDYYTIDLCPPYWRPDPIDEPMVPVYVAGVNPFNLQLAGHLCEGLHVHPLHSPAYIEEEVLPYVEKGAARSERSLDDVTLATTTLAVTGTNEEQMDAAREEVRRQISFYGSTRTYRRIFEVHGWGSVVDELHELSVEGAWDEMPELVSDEMIATYAIEAPWDGIRDALEERYTHIDRVALYQPFRGEDHWRQVTEG